MVGYLSSYVSCILPAYEMAVAYVRSLRLWRRLEMLRLLPLRKQRGIGCHSVLDTESSFLSLIPGFAGMALAKQASGNEPEEV